MSFRVSEATRNLITTKPEFCHSEHRRCEESLLLYKHKLFFTLRWRYFWRKSNQNVGDGVDRRQWRMKGDGGPPARGMSRSDKGSAGSGEDGETTSRQEGLQPVAVCDDCFSGPFMVAIPPRPTNAAQVWNAPSATNREKLQTLLTTFSRTVIFPRFTQAYRHL